MQLKKQRERGAFKKKALQLLETGNRKAKRLLLGTELDEKLIDFASVGNSAEVNRLIRAGAKVNAKNYRMQTALMFAANGGHLDVCVLLIKKGADANAVDWEDSTTLMWATQNGHTEICRLLIENGADVNARNVNGVTALAIAKRNNHKETADSLGFFSMLGTEKSREFLVDFRACVGSV